jgi:predicted RNA-binding Zn-ribbon protein involved in translation (DUF1610 family)
MAARKTEAQPDEVEAQPTTEAPPSCLICGRLKNADEPDEHTFMCPRCGFRPLSPEQLERKRAREQNG